MEHTVPEATSATRGRVLAGAVVGLVGGFTTLYFTTLNQFIEPLSREFGWSRSGLSAVAALALLGSALAAPAAGRLIQRRGARPVIAVSTVLLALGFVALANMPADQGYLAGVALLIGVLTVPTTALGYLAVVPRFFDRRLGLALGVAAAGGGVGGAAVAIVLGGVIQASGWRTGYLVLAVLAVVLSGVAIAVGFPAGTGPTAKKDDPTTPASTAEGLSVREALRMPSMIITLVCLFLSAAAALGFGVHLVAYLVDRGTSPQAAAAVAALGGIGVTVGRLLCGLLLDRFRASWVAAGTFVITASGLVVPALGTADSLTVYGAAALAGGFAIGMETDLIPFLIRRYVGLRSYEPMFGIALGAYGLGAAAGPVLFGLSFDRLGSYAPAPWAGVAAFLVAAVGLQTLGRYRYPDTRSLPTTSGQAAEPTTV